MPGMTSSSYRDPGQPGNPNWLSQGEHSDQWVDPNGYLNLWDPTHQRYLNTGRMDAGWSNENQRGIDNKRYDEVTAENAKRSAAHDAALDALRAQIAQATTGQYAGGPGGVPLDTTSYDSAPDARAETAGYSAAKDKVGLQTRGALKSLQDEASRRGITGSGLQAAGQGQIIAGGASDLSSVVRGQVQDQASHEREYYDTQRADNRNTQRFNADLGERQADRAQQAKQASIQALLDAVSKY